MRVIIVDDFPSMRRMVASLLSTLGFTDITHAKNGKDAWDKISASHEIPEKRFGLAIVDWNMPIMSGIKLLQKVREDEKFSDLAVIMLTAEGMQENILAAIQGGVDDYISKPFEAGIFQGKLLSVASKRHKAIEKELSFFLKTESLKLENSEVDKRHRVYQIKIARINEYIPWSCMGPFALGRLHYNFKKFGKAELSLKKAIDLDFGLAAAHKLLSQTLKALGKVAESVAELEVAVTERPSSSNLRQKLGDAYLREGNYELAIRELSEAIRLSADKEVKLLSKTRSSLGKAKMGKREEAHDEAMKEGGVKEMQQAIQLNPDLISAQYDLMLAYKKTGKPELALSVLEKLKKVEPKDAEGWVALGKTFLNQTDHEKGMFALKKADSMANGSFDIYQEICTQLSDNQLFDEALPFLGKAAECNPSISWSYNMKGIIYRKKGNFTKAIDAYTKASQIDPDDASVFFNLGVAYFKNRQKDKCAGYLKKAVDLDPTLADKVEQYK